MVNNSPGHQAVGLRVIRGKVVLHVISLSASRIIRHVSLFRSERRRKSTFIHSVVGVTTHRGQGTQVFGEAGRVAAVAPSRRYVTQTPSVYADLTVHDNVALFRRGLRGPHRARDRRAIAAVDLTDQMDQWSEPLGRQLSRVSLAAALVASPPDPVS